MWRYKIRSGEEMPFKFRHAPFRFYYDNGGSRTILPGDHQVRDTLINEDLVKFEMMPPWSSLSCFFFNRLILLISALCPRSRNEQKGEEIKRSEVEGHVPLSCCRAM